jgi:MFS family permease
MDPGSRKRLMHLLVIEALVTLAGSLAGVFSVVYLVRSGLSLREASLFYLEAFVVAVAVCALAFRRGIARPRSLMVAAMVLQACFYLSFVVLEGRLLLLVAPVFFGFYIVGFWVPFNILFLELTTRENRGEVISIVFLVFPLVSVFSPIIGGFLISEVSYEVVFVSALVALLSNAALIAISPAASSPPLKPVPSFNALGRRLSTGFFFEGCQEGVWFTCNSLLALLFAGDEFTLGLLLALFALAGGVASVYIARVSDRTGERALYARFGALASAPFIFLAAWTDSTLLYAMAMVALNLTLNLMAIFLFTLSSDRMEADKPSQTLTREVLLNSGRVAGGAVCALVIFVTGDIRLAFASAGLLILGAAVVR